MCLWPFNGCGDESGDGENEIFKGERMNITWPLVHTSAVTVTVW